MEKLTIRFGAVAGIILLAALSRLIPHPFNFTPIGAMGLFGAAYFSKRQWAFIIPGASLWLSDLILNNVVYREYYPTFTLWPGTLLTTYLPFALIILMGFITLKKVNFTNVLGSSLSASVIFFLVSNFFVWLNSANYPQNATGLMLCYTSGLPFFKNGILGDLFYSGVLFGAFELAKRRFPRLSLS
ncbi:MAG: DUF6580 family putative transport protein [Spirosomataceae bacterium]